MGKEVEKKIETVVKDIKSVIKVQEELDKKMANSRAQLLKWQEAMTKTNGLSINTLSQIQASVAHLGVDISGLSKLGNDASNVIEKNNKMRTDANNKELQGLRQNIEKQSELAALYNQKTLLIAESSKLAKQAIKDEYDHYGQKVALIEDETERGVTQLRLAEERNKKLVALDEKMWEDIRTSSVEYYIGLEAQGKKAADTIIDNAATVRLHTSDMRKGIVDIDATKANFEQVKKEMESYQASLGNMQKEICKIYANQLSDESLTAEERKRIMQEEELFSKKHNEFETAEANRVSGAVAKIEKAGQALRLEQVKGYAEKYAALMTKVSEAAKVVTDSVGQTFGKLSESYANDAKMAEDRANISNAKSLEAAERQKEIEKKIESEKEAKKVTSDEDGKQRIDERIELLTKESEEEKKTVEFQAEEKKKHEAKQKKAETKQRRMKKIQEKSDMVHNIMKATGDVAMGAAKALSYGPFLGPILATLVTVAGAVQIGIMAKQLAKFEDGGLLQGKRHSQGGMRIQGSNIEVEGGEYVVNRESTSKNIGLMRYINSQRRSLTPDDMGDYFNKTAQGYEPPFSRIFEAGGELPIVPNNESVDNQMLVDAIRSIRFAPTVAVTDILRVQDDMNKVTSWSGV